MASYSEPRILAFKAAAAQAAYKAVKAGADREHVAVCSAKTDKHIVIAQSAPTAADVTIEVAVPGGGAKALLGSGGASMGDLLAPTTGGELIVTTTAADRYIAMAMEDGAEGDVIAVEVVAGLI